MRTLKLAIRRLRINKKKLQFEKVSFPLILKVFFKRHAASKQTKHEKLALDCQRKLQENCCASFYSRFARPFFLAYFRRKMGFVEFLAILAKKYTINYEPLFCAISKITPLKIKPL
jgi:hypothetical protein